ncbi:MAG: hypothetical protein R2795_21475 [Saprospiraceae bacterium]
MFGTRNVSFWIYLFVCYVLLRTLLVAKPWREAYTIGYDAAGYYLPLPAQFIYDDLAQFTFYDTLSQQYGIGDAVSHTIPLPNGNRTLKYSLGMAVLYSPGFFIGHQVALHSDAYEADGYAKPYYVCLLLWSLAWAFFGLWMLRKVLLHYFSQGTTAIVLVLLVLGTNYLIYAGINNLMAHSFLFTLYACLLYLSWQWHQSKSWLAAIGIGVVLGLMILTRPTELIAAFIPLLWGIGRWADVSTQLRTFWQYRWQLLTTLLIVIAVGSVQLLYWKNYTGEWLYYSYQEQGFDFLHPKLWKGAFSFKKGWLIYTPVMLFAVVGLRWLYQQHRSLFWPMLVFSIVNYYIVFSWKIWMYGGSVGARAMIQSYAVWCFPLAAFVQHILSDSRRYGRIAFAVLALLFIDLNIMMTWQSHSPNGSWYADYMTRAYYWRTMGRTYVDKDHRKFLNISTELSNTNGYKIDTLFTETFDQPQDSTILGRTQERVNSGAFALKLDNQATSFRKSLPIPLQDDYKNCWIRLGVRSFFTDMEWNEWRMVQLNALFLREGKEVKRRGIRLQWLSTPWNWHHAHFEVPITDVLGRKPMPSDTIVVEILNDTGEKALFLDDLYLTWMKKE